MNARRHLLTAAGIWIVLSAIGVLLVVGIQIIPVIASREAEIENTAFVLLTAASVPVLMLVVVVLGYAAVRFRATGEMVDGPALHGHFGFQTLWIAVSFVLVIFLFGYGAFGLIEIRGNQVADFEVQVEAEQWAWHYEYDSDGSGPIDRVQSNELHIPVNRRVHLTIKSDDVIHSFWVPAFGIKQDAVPGHPTSVYLTATNEGTYSGMCAELCGLGHTGMTTTAVASSQVELEAWLRAQPRPTAEPPRGTRSPGPPLTPSAPPQ